MKDQKWSFDRRQTTRGRIFKRLHYSDRQEMQ